VVDDPFELHRSHLFGVAYRMLGSRAEAEDAVQEAWLRYATARSLVEDLRAWLTTVVARICLDVLRSARVRREAYVGPWLPEPLVSRLPGPPGGDDPAETTVRAEQVSLALMVVLERLRPEQRVAFVLHDVFEVPYEAIAEAMDTSPGNARQLASRARRTIGERSPTGSGGAADLDVQRRVVAAFMAAAHRGDLAALARILAPDVELVGDGGGLAPTFRRPLVGIDEVSRFYVGLFRRAERGPPLRAEAVSVNGDLGLVVESGDALVVMAPVVVDEQIVAIYHILNPEKLLEVPRPAGVRATWPPAVNPPAGGQVDED
jgi:RNA polymerase sigma-70 factor (ECF subfamily)